ncbi:MAG: hypothetical protein ACPGQL_07215 [Thermoplasmatota archaeon]
MRFQVLLVAAALLAAGCLADDDPRDSDPAARFTEPSGAATLPWGLTDCQAVIATVAADEAALAPFLPDGFRSLSMTEVAGLGLPVDPVGGGNLGIEVLTCASGVGLDGSIQGLHYGSVFTMVEPPAELADGNVTFHFVKWDVMIPDQPRRDVLAGRGVPAVDGAGYMLQFQQVGDATLFDAVLEMDGDVHTLRGAAAAPYDTEGSFVEFTAVPDGFVTWHTVFTWASVAVGPVVLEPSPGSLVAEILGTGPAVGAAFAGVIDLHDARIELPATSPAESDAADSGEMDQ